MSKCYFDCGNKATTKIGVREDIDDIGVSVPCCEECKEQLSEVVE